MMSYNTLVDKRIYYVLRLTVVLLLGFFLLVSPMPTQAQTLKIGDTAPTLSATVGGRAFAGFEKGKVYVVEFWATWCSPCVATFGHLNQLVQAMKSEPVVFLSVTNEGKEKVGKLLQAKPLNTQIAYDQNGKTFDRYGVKVLPHMVIVGKDGKIIAITDPQFVTEDTLHKVLGSATVQLPEKTNITADLNWDKTITTDTPEAIAQVVIQRSNADAGSLRFRPNTGRIVGDGVGLAELIQAAYGARFYEVRSSLPQYNTGRYRVSLCSPDGKDDTARTMLRGVLPALQTFTASWREEEQSVPVLKRVAGAPEPKSSAESKYDGFANDGDIDYVAAPMKEIATTLGSFVYQTNVFDETGWNGAYDFKLSWVPGDKKSLEAALKQYGIQVVMEKRTVHRLLVVP